MKPSIHPFAYRLHCTLALGIDFTFIPLRTDDLPFVDIIDTANEL